MAKGPQKRKATGRGREATQFGNGQPTNKGGRPKGIMQYVRDQTKDGKELVDFALDVVRGEPVICKFKGIEVLMTPDMTHRMDAMKWLGDRGFGKAMQETEVTVNGGGLVVYLPKEEG